jgi:hypothetical protein
MSSALPRCRAMTGALVLALCLLLLSGTADRAQALPIVGSLVPGEIIIKLTPNAPESAIAVINDRYNTRVKERFLDSADTDIYLLEITDGSSTKDKLDKIIGDKLRIIEYAEPNYFAEVPEAALSSLTRPLPSTSQARTQSARAKAPRSPLWTPARSSAILR